MNINDLGYQIISGDEIVRSLFVEDDTDRGK